MKANSNKPCIFDTLVPTCDIANLCSTAASLSDLTNQAVTPHRASTAARSFTNHSGKDNRQLPARDFGRAKRPVLLNTSKAPT